MHTSLTNFNTVLNPLYAVAVMAVVTALAWLCGYVVPFYRRALAVEAQTRLTPLDGLRGLLCFAVLCHHAVVTFGYLHTGTWNLPPSNVFALLGQTPVALFFCVTAFLFWSRVVTKEGQLSPRSFLQARFFRIVPLYIFSCLLSLGVVSRQIHWSSDTTIAGLARMALLGIKRWGMVGDLSMDTVNAGVTWTLQYEWGFYLLLPALALIARDPRDARRLWFIALGAAVLLEPGPGFYFLPGVLAVYAVRQPRLLPWLRSRPAALAVIAVALAHPMLIDYGFDYPGLAVTTVIFVPIACGNSLFGILNWRPLRLMGLVSYSVYLLHGIGLFLARPILQRATFEAPVEFWWYWYCIGGCALATLAFSLSTYRWIEWPFIQWERRMRQGSRTANAVVGAEAAAGPQRS